MILHFLLTRERSRSILTPTTVFRGRTWRVGTTQIVSSINRNDSLVLVDNDVGLILFLYENKKSTVKHDEPTVEFLLFSRLSLLFVVGTTFPSPIRR